MIISNYGGKPILRSLFVAILLPPLKILVPPHYAFPTLIPPQLHAPPYVIRDLTSPPSLADGAIDRLDLVPPLLWNDFRQVGCGE